MSTQAQAYDNTNSGIISPRRDGEVGEATGFLNIEGKEYRVNGGWSSENNAFELTLITGRPSDGFNPFSKASLPKPAGTAQLKLRTATSPKAPNYSGFSLVNDVKYHLSGWNRMAKTGKNAGSEFIAVKVQSETDYQKFRAAAQGTDEKVKKGATRKIAD